MQVEESCNTSIVSAADHKTKFLARIQTLTKEVACDVKACECESVVRLSGGPRDYKCAH